MPGKLLLFVAVLVLASAQTQPWGATGSPIDQPDLLEQLIPRERLIERWNRFAKTSRGFADEYNRGIFDVNAARKMSKQWREIEASGEWPR